MSFLNPYYGFLHVFYFIVLSIVALLSKRTSRGVYYFFVIILILIVALKPIGTYPDDRNYLDLLQFYRTNSLPVENEGRDYLYYGLAEFFSFVLGDRRALVGISLFSILVKSIVIGKVSEYSLLALMTIFSLSVQLTDLTTLRTALATSFLFLSIYSKLSGRTYISVLFYMASVASHIQMLLLLPIMLAVRNYMYVWKYTLILLIIVFGTFHLFPFSELSNIGFPAVDVYLMRLSNDLEEGINLYRYSTMAILVLIIYLDKITNNRNNNYYNLLFILAVLSQLSGFLFYWFPVLSGRLGEILLPFLIVYLALTLQNVSLVIRSLVVFIMMMISVNYIFVNPLYLRDGVLY